MYGYIYLNKCIPTGKIYIGQHMAESFDPNYYGSGILWKKALAKYSKRAISRRVIAWCETEEQLNKAEKFYIEYFDARNPEIGYNIADGGYSLCNSDICKQISKTLKRKYSSGEITPAMLGKHHTEAAKDKVSKANKGRKHTKEWLDAASKRNSGKNNPRYGVHFIMSEEQKNKIRNSSPMLGKHWKIENGKRVYYE